MNAVPRASSASIGWTILAVVAVIAAAISLARWLALLVTGVPSGYGEGAVAHAAAILARGGDPYAAEAPGTFVSANYPPLAYVVAALGSSLGPFTLLRVVGVVALCAVALVAGWRARTRPVAAVAIGASFLALSPVAAWGASARADVLAVAGVALAIAALSPDPRRLALAGILGALAVAAKPTAAVPLAAVLVWLAWRERGVAVRFAIALGVAGLAALAVALARFDAAGLWRHVVTYNALPYDGGHAVLLLGLAALLLGAFAWAAWVAGDGRMRAYLAGGIAVVALGGHAGATFNYLLDVAAASSLALAPLASRGGRIVAVMTGQLIATTALTVAGPLAPPSVDALRARVDAVRTLPAGAVLAEDSGPLLAAGREPIVDDAYQWARLVAAGRVVDDVTPRVRDARFAAVVADIPLEDVARASEVERERWPAELANAVLARYRLERHEGGLWVYRPR